jgi:hypothetical protein
LPGSLLQEHLRERRQKYLLSFQEGIVLHRLYSPRLYRLCAAFLVAWSILYLLSAVSAYFVFDLQTHSLANTWEWWHAIGDQPTYIFYQAPLLYTLGILLYLSSPLWIVLTEGLLTLMLWQGWSQLSINRRRLGILALLAGVTVFLSMATPIGEIVFLWFYD